jgi:hypothetical protein
LTSLRCAGVNAFACAASLTTLRACATLHAGSTLHAGTTLHSATTFPALRKCEI